MDVPSKDAASKRRAKSPLLAALADAGSVGGTSASGGVLKSGLLLKQGYVVKSWRERYFALQTDRLCYYDPSEMDGARQGAKPRGALLLSDVVGVTPLRARGAFQVSVVGSSSTGSSRSGDRDFYLVAASDNDRFVGHTRTVN